MSAREDEPVRLHLVGGALRIPHSVYERHFAGLEACVLVRLADDLMVMPVRHLPSGGHLLKIRTPAGDRVVGATDFFRDQGVDDRDRWIDVVWDRDRSGLVAPNFFAGL